MAKYSFSYVDNPLNLGQRDLLMKAMGWTSCCGIAPRVRFDSELFLKIGQGQDRCRNQALLENLEALFCVISPNEQHPFFEKIEKRSRQYSKLASEPAVISCQSEEFSDLLDTSGSGPCCHCLYFTRVSCHPLCTDDVP